jgi:hypothetical protein
MMSELHCPHCESPDWLPVVRLFLDVGIGRPPRPLALDEKEEPNPEAICFRCVNGCVGITTTGQFVPTLARLGKESGE